MSSIRPSLLAPILAAVALPGLLGAGCESTHETFDVAGDTSGGDGGPPLSCAEVLTCASGCAGDTTCEDACAARVCAAASAALDALEACQTDHCATQCADPTSTDCIGCMSTNCLTQYSACTAASCP